MPSGEGRRWRHQLMAFSMSVMWMPAMLSPRVSIGQAHGRADFAQRLARHRARALGRDLDDPLHLLRIRQVFVRPLAPWRLLARDRLDQRLLAVEAADAGGRAALGGPGTRAAVRVELVQRPDRAVRRIPGIAKGPPVRVGG